MSHKVMEITTRENYIIEATFLGGEKKQYDVKQLFLRFPQFKILQKNTELFQRARVDAGGYGILWNDELDLDAETIWEDGILIEEEQQTDANRLLAYHLLMQREKKNMTQKELSEKTGIYQADISKIERGLGNPSLSTLKRLADGLGMNLVIDFQNK